MGCCATKLHNNQLNYGVKFVRCIYESDMKVKQFIIPIALITIAMVFQACPDPNLGPIDRDITEHGAMSVVTMEDTIQVRYRDNQKVFRTIELLPSPYVQAIEWLENDGNESKTEEQCQKIRPQVKKLTNHNTSYVLHGTRCFVNDISASYYYVYRDPSDTIKTYYQFGQLVEQKIPLHPKPCELDVIIDALIEQYPDRITVLDDTEVHYIDYLYDGGENSTRLTINL